MRSFVVFFFFFVRSCQIMRRGIFSREKSAKFSMNGGVRAMGFDEITAHSMKDYRLTRLSL